MNLSQWMSLGKDEGEKGATLLLFFHFWEIEGKKGQGSAATKCVSAEPFPKPFETETVCGSTDTHVHLCRCTSTTWLLSAFWHIPTREATAE